jgi:hypothetical protein
MTESFGPGIYIEQLPAQHHPMFRGSTSTAGFIGAGGSAGVPFLGVAGFSRQMGHALGSALGSPGINRLHFIPVDRTAV